MSSWGGKLRPIYIIFLISAAFEIIARVFLRNGKLGDIIYNVWDFLFLRGFGFASRHELLVGASWFLFALFPAIAILYPIFRKFKDMFLYVIAPLIACFILGWFYQVYGNVNFALHLSKDKMICLGLLRAIAEVCVGCIAYLIYSKVKDIKKNTQPSFIYATIEVLSFLLVLLFAIYGSRSKTDFICILLISIGIITSCSGRGINLIFKRLDDSIINYFSKYSICLYLNHYVWLRTLQNWKLNISFHEEISLYVILSAITSYLCLILIKPVERMISRAYIMIKKI